MPYTFRCAMRYSLFSAAFAALASLAFSLAFSEAWAQGLPPDDGGFEIETETQQDSGFDWNQYVGGSVGVVTADGDAISRQLAAMRLDINLPATDRVKTVLSIDAVDFENTYAQELKDEFEFPYNECVRTSPNATAPNPIHPGEAPVFGDGISNEEFVALDRELDAFRVREEAYDAARTDLNNWQFYECERFVDDGRYIPEEQGTDVTDSFADFREAYVQWEPTDYATVAIGRQNLVWGQFDFLSPVGFLLPFRTTNTSTRPSRADFSFAQDAAALSLFPTGNSELKLIHVPQMRVDKSVEGNLKSYAQRRECGVAIIGQETKCERGDEPGSMTPLFPEAADYEMSALRFTHYGERLTFAITALDGTQVSFDPYRDATLVRDGVNGNDCSTFEDDDGETEHYLYCWRNDKGLAFGELETLALEFAYILNPRVTIKGELVTYEGRNPENLYSFENLADVRPMNDEVPDNLAHAITTYNQGKPYITTDEIFLALGFEYEGDKWFGHLQLVAIDSEPASKVDEVLECIKDDGSYDGELECGPSVIEFLRSNADDDSSEIAPVFFIGRRLGDEDEGFVGGGATAFFNAYGFGIFGGWRFNENIELGGFLGSVVDVTDSGPQSSTYYDSIDDGDSMAQIGITYLF